MRAYHAPCDSVLTAAWTAPSIALVRDDGGRPRFTHRRRLAAMMALLTVSGSCFAEQPSRPPATVVSTTSPAGSPDPIASVGRLPIVVVDERDAIARAARAFDYAALRLLLDPATFKYSSREAGDPIEHWRQLEEDGHVPILGDFLPAVLATEPAKQGDTYVWPGPSLKQPSDWTDDDLAAIAPLYGGEDLQRWHQLGRYTGWQVGIREDGTWLFFLGGE